MHLVLKVLLFMLLYVTEMYIFLFTIFLKNILLFSCIASWFHDKSLIQIVSIYSCQKFTSLYFFFKLCFEIQIHELFLLQQYSIFSCYLSLVVRKPAFCICENKDADQLHSNCAADQRLCFRYIDSSLPLLSKSKISRL